jgi:hypothetical protein
MPGGNPGGDAELDGVADDPQVVGGDVLVFEEEGHRVDAGLRLGLGDDQHPAGTAPHPGDLVVLDPAQRLTQDRPAHPELLLRGTDIGLKVRALVDSEALTVMSGASPTRVSLGVWAVSSLPAVY